MGQVYLFINSTEMTSNTMSKPTATVSTPRLIRLNALR
jgi:hypothetical protein